MRKTILGTVAALGLAFAMPALAADRKDDDRLTREEVEERKREVREMERELREQERDEDRVHERRAARRQHHRGRAWIGVGAGVGYGSVETVCSPPSSSNRECTEGGILDTFTGNVTLAGANGAALRLRGIREGDKENDGRTPYETAALIGSRFGRSNWYGLVGYGRVHHPDDEAVKDESGGFAWEILFAPSHTGPVGLELGFQGHNGRQADFVAFNIGMRFGVLR